MIVQKCDFCDQQKECTAITGEHGIYAICSTCAKAMLAREICRVIGHGTIETTHYGGRSVLTGRVYGYAVDRCTRCGKVIARMPVYPGKVNKNSFRHARGK